MKLKVIHVGFQNRNQNINLYRFNMSRNPTILNKLFKKSACVRTLGTTDFLKRLFKAVEFILVLKSIRGRIIGNFSSHILNRDFRHNFIIPKAREREKTKRTETNR